MSNRLEKSLFKALTATLLECEPSQDELLSLVKSLKGGRLNSALSNFVLAYSSLGVSENAISPQKEAELSTKKIKLSAPKTNNLKAPNTEFSVSSMFDLAKRRKITRSQLRDLFDQIHPEISREISEAESMREWLKQFNSMAYSEDWELLRSIISGEISPDPFLRDILNK